MRDFAVGPRYRFTETTAALEGAGSGLVVADGGVSFWKLREILDVRRFGER